MVATVRGPTTRDQIAPEDCERLISALDAIERRGRRADFERAAWARKVVDLTGVYARKVMVEQLKLSTSTAVAYLRRLEDAKLIDDPNVWIAVGWARVRQIAKVDQRSRGAVVSEILSARNERGITPDGRAREILAPYLPKAGEESEPSRRRDAPMIGRALSELRHILENYDLDGYTPPEEIVAFVGAVMN